MNDAPSCASVRVPLASTERFSNRVADYVRYRPGYPLQLPGLLIEQAGLVPGDPVADIGAGTGILTRTLLSCGLRVCAVEPNAAMRMAADAALSGVPGYVSVDGNAEATGLPMASVKLVTAAQAFHWFDPPAARAEFGRILRPAGHVALIWNVRRLDGEFAAGYETLLENHCPEYAEVSMHRHADEAVIARFYAPARYRRYDLGYRQSFDADGLRGRLLSCSYAPVAGTPGHAPMLAALDALFARCQHDGRIDFEYDTRVFIGMLDPG